MLVDMGAGGCWGSAPSNLQRPYPRVLSPVWRAPELDDRPLRLHGKLRTVNSLLWFSEFLHVRFTDIR